MIIDVHTHIFPDSMALEVVPKMAEIAGIKESLDGRLSSLLGSMKKAGIDISWIQPVATKPQQVDKINKWMKEIRSDSIVTFGAFHPAYENLPGLIQDLSQDGFPGIKIHPEYQKITPLDSTLYPLYESLMKENMIVLFHAGVDIGIPTINSTPEMFAQLIEKFPGIKMILAHMGGYEQWDEVSERLCGKDVYLDTSYIFGHCPDDKFVSLVRDHGVDKVLFGTDSPWSDQTQDLEHLKRLPFSQEELDMVCGLNTLELLDQTT